MEGSASKGADQTCCTISQIFKKGIETTAFLFVIAIFVGTFIASRWINTSSFAGSSLDQAISAFRNSVADLEKITYSLNCSSRNDAQTCSSYFPTTHRFATSSPEACPHYFHWIHEDLRPWKSTGITKEMVKQAKRAASVRIVIINGRVYMKKYRYVFQTRDVFTIWGILQLLRLYPGEIPDLDLVYQMDDRPSMKKSDYSGAKSKKMPPLFHFCADRSTFDIIFPDWSFWGWYVKVSPSHIDLLCVCFIPLNMINLFVEMSWKA